jgi:hypothetical protein
LISANFFLRSARSLFSEKIRCNINIALPDPLPFSGVQIERPTSKYFSTFDLGRLVKTARDELALPDPEAFKVLLLSGMAGLRRKEVDLLPWEAFRWEDGVIRIEATRHFVPKTVDSAADVAVDPELMAVFCGYLGASRGAEFVIESPELARPGVNYNHYRCEAVFARLIKWLRKQGVTSAKPIHELRKAFGSAICQRAGIHQASRSLRHSDIRVNSKSRIFGRARSPACAA